MTVEAFRKIYPSEFFERFIEAAVRPDGRNLLGVRQTLVSVGSISSADGSAFVKLSTGVAPNSPACASTSVLAGVTAEVGHLPTPDTPQLYVNVELLPICNAQLFRPGAPSARALSLSSKINELVKQTQLLDVSNLQVKLQSQQRCPVSDDAAEVAVPASSDKPLVWYLQADIYCLEYGGNLLDSCLAALVAALLDTRLPAAFVDPSDPSRVQCHPLTPRRSGIVSAASSSPSSDAYGDGTRVRLNAMPLSLSFGAILDASHLIADPTSDEESLLVDSYSVVLDAYVVQAVENGAAADTPEICAIYKTGGAPLQPAKLAETLAEVRTRVCELKRLIDEALG